MTTIIRIHDFTTHETDTFTGKGIKECIAGLELNGYEIYQEPNENDGWRNYTAVKDGDVAYEISYTNLN